MTLITPKILMTAINDLLTTTFPDVDVIAQEFEKGFKEPSFTVRFSNLRIITDYESFETSLTVRTYYFPELKNPDLSIDLLEKQAEIAQMYGNKLYVLDRALNVDEPEFDEVDNILIHEFQLSFEQFIDEADSATMKNLNINM